MPSSKISDSDFTTLWLEDVLQKTRSPKAKIVDFSASEVGYGRGYASQILIVNLTWDCSYHDLPKSVALKIPGTKQMEKVKTPGTNNDKDEKAEEIYKPDTIDFNEVHNTLIRWVTDCEIAVYDAFRSSPPKSLKVLKCYHGLGIQPGKQGVLVLEDLSHAATTTFARGLPLDGVMEAAEQLAHLHAYSLTNDGWKNEKIEVTFDYSKFGTSYPSQYEINSAALTALKAENPDIFDPLADKASEHLQSMSDITYIFSLNQQMGLPDVFVHGDFHCQNMFL